jgi:hypothetical protein
MGVYWAMETSRTGPASEEGEAEAKGDEAGNARGERVVKGETDAYLTDAVSIDVPRKPTTSRTAPIWRGKVSFARTRGRKGDVHQRQGQRRLLPLVRLHLPSVSYTHQLPRPYRALPRVPPPPSLPSSRQIDPSNPFPTAHCILTPPSDTQLRLTYTGRRSRPGQRREKPSRGRTDEGVWRVEAASRRPGSW